MSFASSSFWIFAITLFLAYFCCPGRYRWVLMLVASYAFYAFWDWRYTPLLLFSTSIDYLCVHRMARLPDKQGRRRWLWLSVGINLGVLFLFKYWNFAGTNLNHLLGTQFEVHHLLLPLGISFYTFQSLSYTLDAYGGKVKPERHFGHFCLYISFFPQLVAGPIERSQSLLPQVKQLGLATVEQFRFGLLLIVWGLFLKLVIADNLTPLINGILFSDEPLPFYLYWFAGALVSLKIYCDFMAYSEMARGLAQLFGVKLTRNFRRPFLATSLSDFWQRWHISLTRWIGVYVQIPMMKRFPKGPAQYAVTIVTMTLIGLWHGASWNFVLFGLYHGLLLAIWKPVARVFTRGGRLHASLATLIARIVLGIVWMSGSVLFYVADPAALFKAFGAMLDPGTLFDPLQIGALPGKFSAFQASIGLCLLTLYSLLGEYRRLETVDRLAVGASRWRWLSVSAIFFLIFALGNFNAEDFIYFEF